MKPEIKIGQIYRDKDRRMLDRFLRVEYIPTVGDRIELSPCTQDGTLVESQRRYKIRKASLQSRFELIDVL